MTEAIIQIQDLEKRFRSKNTEVYALQGINLTIRKGDIFGIIGKSGAGKSTLVRCINMLERPTGGSVMFEGRDMCRLGSRDLQIARRSMGMIFQQFNLLMQRTAEENICFPLELAGVKKDAARERARELLELVNLSDRAQSYPSQLSGGQKQRVAIARALATNPKILLCDEATSALDPATTESILSLIKDINRRLGITAIIITHEMSVIEKICNQVAIISHGELPKPARSKRFSSTLRPKRRASSSSRGLAGHAAQQAVPDHFQRPLLVRAGHQQSAAGMRGSRQHHVCRHARHRRDGIRPDGAATSGQRRGRPAYPRLCRLQGTDAGGNEECLIRLPSKCCLKASWTRCT